MTAARPLVFGWLFLFLAGPALAAGETKAKQPADLNHISYYRDIRPLFQQKCQGCHQPARPKGSYVMTSHADLLKPGESKKPGIVPGRPEVSVLFEQITSQGGKPPKMPRG